MRPHPTDLIPGGFSAFGVFVFILGALMGAGLVGWAEWWRGFWQAWILFAGVCGLIGGLVWLSMRGQP